MKQAKRKITEYEYWPAWAFYGPFIPYFIWNSLKSGSFSYFCKVNPGIEFGGLFDYSKYKILEQIPDEFKPRTEFHSEKPSEITSFDFPFVVKPDIGERGKNVEIIHNPKDWENYPVQKNIILQEMLTEPLEFGVFYIENPHTQKGEISSITGKEFLVFRADGKTSLGQFLSNHPRVTHRLDYFQSKYKKEWNEIFPKGEEILLEPIGNHNRGTRFFDASDLATSELLDSIEEIAHSVKGFHYGRFDVKAATREEFQQGKFKVIEINGANSEPTHIYDSNYSLWKAYKEVKRHLDLQYQLSKTKPKKETSREFFKVFAQRIFS